ncbi:MAG: penicillin-binding protein [Myxococcota bacterium]|nr:penicillin-binding protein [Myxococcota bacterium]
MNRNFFRRKAPRERGAGRTRMLVVAVAMALGFIGVLSRAWYLQVERNDLYLKRSKGQHQTTVQVTARRGDIYDRTGRELALSALVPSLYAIPRMVENPTALGSKLAAILKVPAKKIISRLARKNEFIWLKRHVTTQEAKAIANLSNPAVKLRSEPRRFYPNRALAGAVLGFAGIDGHGLEGVERDFDHYLRGKTYSIDALRDARGRYAAKGGALPVDDLAGYSINLSIDARIQQVAERALAAQIEAMDAEAAVAVVMDVRTGDLLAIAQTPAFDPNLFRHARPKDWRNRAITDVLEPGSTIKPFLIAAALDAGKIKKDSIWDGMGGRIRVGAKTITDVHGVEQMTTLEIVQKSSNVGAVQVGQRVGKEVWHRYLRAFGFGADTELGLRGEQIGVLRSWKKWGQIHLATFSYGYGLSVTPIQMVRGMAALANGGLLMKPRLITKVTGPTGVVIEEFPPQVLRRVLSEEASAATREALHMVTLEGGTGRRARVPGYRVAGKTGTAHKVDPKIRGYSKDKVWASFAGFAPLDDPRIAVYVIVDEPKKAHYGGVVAAPIFAEIVRYALPHLGVEASESTDAYLAHKNGQDTEAFARLALDPQARPWWYERAILTGAKQHLSVPDLSGMSLGEAVAFTQKLGVRLRVDGAGIITAQRPQPGSLVGRDSVLFATLELPGDAPRVGRRP